MGTWVEDWRVRRLEGPISLEEVQEAAVLRISSEDYGSRADRLVASTEIHSRLTSKHAGRDPRAYAVATRRGTYGWYIGRERYNEERSRRSDCCGQIPARKAGSVGYQL